MIMQRAYLFPGTIAENVRFGPEAAWSFADATRLSKICWHRWGWLDTADRDTLTLSGGEAQRVAITRALANEPEILLLDEPTSALDEVAKLGVESLLESLIRKQHLTCVWVTHDAAQAGAWRTVLLMLEAGRMIGARVDATGVAACLALLSTSQLSAGHCGVRGGSRSSPARHGAGAAPRREYAGRASAGASCEA